MKTPIEELDEQIEREKDPQRLIALKNRRERLLRAQAEEPTGHPEEDALWRRRKQVFTSRAAQHSRMDH